MSDRRRGPSRSAVLALVAGALLSGTSAVRADSGSAVAARDLAVRHTKLRRSSPAADASLPSAPTAVTLWFTKPVQVKLTRVQLTDAAGQPVALERPTASVAGDTVVVAALRGALRAGSYTVAWATTSRDSHVIKGSFRFRVQGSAATSGDTR